MARPIGAEQATILCRSLRCPVARSTAYQKLRPVLHLDSDRVILARRRLRRLEADDVLPVNFGADGLHRFLQRFLSRKAQGAAAGGVGEFVGSVRLQAVLDLREYAKQATRSGVVRDRLAILLRVEALHRLLPRGERCEERRIRDPINQHVLALRGVEDFRQLELARAIVLLGDDQQHTAVDLRPPPELPERFLNRVEGSHSRALYPDTAQRTGVATLDEIGRA